MLFFKQKTAYEMRISDWSSDVCSSDLAAQPRRRTLRESSAAARPKPTSRREGLPGSALGRGLPLRGLALNGNSCGVVVGLRVAPHRSAERRVAKTLVSTCSYRRATLH